MVRHSRDCLPASNVREIPAHATTWVNLGDVTLGEISQLQEDRYYMLRLSAALGVSNPERQKVERWLRGAVEGREASEFDGDSFHLGRYKSCGGGRW